ncbi:MAG: hypothetical protein GY792_13095 [Gammaproteobacteria bacterium]|nr:hypothetical protein [Gammaproteobacteria bacterium]
MTPDIDAVVKRANAINGKITTMYLFGLKKGGKQRGYQGVIDLWTAASKIAGVENAHLHDLRAKSLTDAKAQGHNPQQLGLHSTEAMTLRYLRDLETPTARGPSLPGKATKS